MKKNNSLRNLCVAITFIAASLGSFMVKDATAAAPTPGTTNVTYSLAFYSATQTFAYDVVKAKSSGVLTVDTRDCCIPGDKWQVDVHTAVPASPSNDVIGIGDGNTSTFSGAASAHVNTGCVQVSYSSGVNVFPAGMEVRLQYVDDEGFGVNITPRPSGTCA